MTGAESTTLAAFRQEYQQGDRALRDELAVVREEVAGVRSEVAALRDSNQPAMDFYIALNRAAKHLAAASKAAGVAIKWGAGLGASVFTMLAAAKALGWW